MWLRNITVWSASVLFVVIVSGAWFVLQPAAAQNQPGPVVQKAAKDDKLAKLLKDRYDRAAKVFETARAEFLAGRALNQERICQWSAKMLEAELEWKPSNRIQAHIAHLDRIKELHTQEKQRFEVGASGALTFAVAEHALTEAELWLAREKAKK